MLWPPELPLLEPPLLVGIMRPVAGIIFVSWIAIHEHQFPLNRSILSTETPIPAARAPLSLDSSSLAPPRCASNYVAMHF